MKHGYGQFCPLAKAAELLCERWTMIVVRELVAGSRRFNDLRRGVPLMSPTLLSRRLKQLTVAGVVQRVVDRDGSSAYELTRAGQELQPLVALMGAWGHRWVGSRLEADDLDVGLLMWDIRRTVDSTQFPDRRVVVEFVFTDAPEGMERWWLVCDAGEVDLCRDDPGHEVDLVLRSTVRALTEVWMCRQTLAGTERAGDLQVLGPDSLRQRVALWLRGSALARLGAESLAAERVTDHGAGRAA
ncbi:MAG: winged helix-turn-helix transcriptional regulator [Gemmatimonadota bacterium]